MSLKQLALKYLPAPVLRSVRMRHYRNSLRNFSVSVEPDILGCKALLRPGDTVIDVGANIGVYTRFCSEYVGPTGHVHSLEPIPETYSYLTENVQALDLTNVTCYNLAASQQDRDHAAMTMAHYEAGGSNIYEAHMEENGEIPVKTVRLDTLFPSAMPRLIKCDVEGHELSVIKGALELIARARPAWVIEVSNDETWDLFDSLGYDPFVCNQGNFRPKEPNEKARNFFFFARENHQAAAR